MNRTNILRRGTAIGRWKLLKKIGSGGNGQVWEALDGEGSKVAIKFLAKANAKAYRRFCDEIKVLKLLGEVPGIIPILDFTLPNVGLEIGKTWYAMPLAKTVDIASVGQSPLDLIKSFCLLGKVIEGLHARGITHRDIKPQNVLLHQGRLCLSDFGLVDYPHKEPLTAVNERVGPFWLMPPEMKRQAHLAKGAAVDVYLFAKTIWIFLTGDVKCFDGQYVEQSPYGLKFHLKDLYLPPLDELFEECTDNDPKKRPSIAEVVKRLEDWIQIQEDYIERNEQEWTRSRSRLFPYGSPDSARWTKVKEIISVLRELCREKSLNHMFLPDGGGIDLSDADLAWEGGFIELKFDGLVSTLKPKALSYELIDGDPLWGYFLLEAEEVPPTGLYKRKQVGCSEELTEIHPGTVTHRAVLDLGEFNETPLAGGARSITRYFKGRFAIFHKTSVYNLIPETYSAWQNSLDPEQFKATVSLLKQRHDQKLGKKMVRTDSSRRLRVSKMAMPKSISGGKKEEFLKTLSLGQVRTVANLAEKLRLARKKGEKDFLKIFDLRSLAEFQPRKEEKELAQYIKSLGTAGIEELVALMIFGRDQLPSRTNWSSSIKSASSMSDKENVEYLCEKSSLDNYLKEGLRKLGISD